MTTKQWLIRKFEQRDQDSVRSIYRETVAANPNHYYRPLSGPQLPDNVSENFAHPNDAFYIAESQGRVIGFCGIRTLPEDRGTGSFVNGTVVPEFRGCGVYRELFKIREREAIQKGVKIFLAITSHYNVKMKEHLLRDGFEIYHPKEPISGFYHLRKMV